MRTLVTLEFLALVLLTFGLRSFLHWRATGQTGIVRPRGNARAVEHVAQSLAVLAFVLVPIAPWIGEPLWNGGQVFGAVLALVGIVLAFVAQLQMGRSWRIGVDATERTELVTTGLFALVRNPIFSGLMLVALGVALAVPTPLAVAVPPLLLLAIELQVRFVEEPYLVRTHGAPYLDWAARTGRFVPGIGRLKKPTAAPPGAASTSTPSER